MACPDPLLIEAYVDGELDAATAVGIEQHLEGCPACAALRRSTAETSRLIRGGATYHRLSEFERAALLRGIRAADSTRAPPSRSRRWHYWSGVTSGAVAAALATLAVTGIVSRDAGPNVVDDVVGAHVRSLLSDRLIDVESSDRHTVKPWFTGHADVSPPVVDFPEKNYHLVGGRVDYVDGRRAAVVVYRHGAHVINVFAWPDSRSHLPSGIVSRNGYNLSCWKSTSVDYCVASDAGGEELTGLTRLLLPLTQDTPRE
jgi:anti-sigma factor RsiW